MPTRRRAAFGLWTALTFSAAVILHGIVHAAGSGAFEWDSPAHLVMLMAAAGLLGASALHLGAFARASERRRRVALVRAALGPPTLAGALAQIALQAGIAASIFLVEGPAGALEPQRLGAALGCGLLALLFTSLVFRRTQERFIETILALSGPASETPRQPLRRRPAIAAPRPTETYRLFIPNRPPPIPAA